MIIVTNPPCSKALKVQSCITKYTITYNTLTNLLATDTLYTFMFFFNLKNNIFKLLLGQDLVSEQANETQETLGANAIKHFSQSLVLS
jgi:hypothetical protein